MNELIIVIQSALSVYVLYLLILYKERGELVLTYFLTSLYFNLLKFEIIDFNDGSLLDYISWGLFNIGIYVFIIYYILRKNGRKTNNNIS